MAHGKGNLIQASDQVAVMNKIKEMRARWGIATTSNQFYKSAGQTMLAQEFNWLIDYINEGKAKSGWSGVVSPKVSVGSPVAGITQALINQAEAIRTHCPCNCNHCACNCNHCACNCKDCCNKNDN